MRKIRSVLIENHLLADGGTARVTRLGREYQYSRTYTSFDQPPDLTCQLTKGAAYRLLGDALVADVCED